MLIKPRAPHTIYRTDESTVRKIVAIRKMTNRNEYAIASYLKRQGVSISHSTVYNILKRNSLINALAKPRKQRTYIRFSRKRPNSLWQADLTVFGSRYAVAFLDDCSRFVTAMDFIPEGGLKSVLSVFRQAIGEHGKPKQILTDHGTQFYSVRRGDSKFDKFCVENNIRHILGGIGKPTTQGKIERFFQSFKKEYVVFDSIEEYLQYYNYRRLHGGISYNTPAEVYFSKK